MNIIISLVKLGFDLYKQKNKKYRENQTWILREKLLINEEINLNILDVQIQTSKIKVLILIEKSRK